PKLLRLQRLNRRLPSSQSPKLLRLLSPRQRRNPSQKSLLLLGPPRRRSQDQKLPQLRRPRPVRSWPANLHRKPKRKLTARATLWFGPIPARRSITTLQAAATATRRSAHTCARKKPQGQASGLPRGKGACRGFRARSPDGLNDRNPLEPKLERVRAYSSLEALLFSRPRKTAALKRTTALRRTLRRHLVDCFRKNV